MENRRKTIVINKKFQHHYALLFVACTIILTLFVGVLYILVLLLLLRSHISFDKSLINLNFNIHRSIQVFDNDFVNGRYVCIINIASHNKFPFLERLTAIHLQSGNGRD